MRFWLIDDQGEETVWVPEDRLGEIHALARKLAAELPAGAAVGLLFRSGAALLLHWFACVNAGLRPLIVQYPTRKQSRAYWFDSVTHTIATAGLDAIVADAYCAQLGLPDSVRMIPQDALPAGTVADAGPLLPAQFTILQLSSGTTGYRKAMEFSGAALRRHAEDFNQVLRLEPGRDRIVSWLPLYHDMGYIACFVMPILLGIDVVMMDPVTWVGAPELLFDAIERHQGTICYMPNFGYEVMTRAPGRPLPSMRHWVCAGEQVSARTAAKFCAHLAADPATFRPLFGMAENLFAITIGSGFNTRVIDGAEVVSCGPPIPGVQLKTVDGQIWVRAGTAIPHYLGGQELGYADGYYPSGDIGQLLDGELYVAGRMQDLLIQAGRKFMLSDVDIKLNEAFPEIRGRAATLAIHDERLGTETPLILIEAVDFFDRTDMADIAARMIDLTGMDQMEVAYVPPRFLTKTSSGKMNRRKCRADWLAVQAAKTRTGGARDAVAELRAAFAHVDWALPIGEVLDSLSRAIVRICLESTPIAFDASQSLNALVDLLKSHQARTVPDAAAPETGLRIISLADRLAVEHLTEADLARMGEALGCRVTLEHICLPPSPILLSDLVFHDWFQPRLAQQDFADVDYALDRLKGASLVLVDSVAEFKFLYSSTYPALSHNLQRDPRADLICLRWPSYTRQHHKLPLSCVAGTDIPLDAPAQTLKMLQRYLGAPIFRIASARGFERYDADWDFRLDGRTRRGGGDTRPLTDALTAWIKARPEIVQRPLRPGAPLLLSDARHFCAIAARKRSVDAVVARFERFCVVGQPASLPYLRQRLEAEGKAYDLVPSAAPEILDTLAGRHDCIITCGSAGDVETDLPVIAFQHVGEGWRTRNLGPFEAELMALGRLNEPLVSGKDWFHVFEPGASEADRAAWKAARGRQAGAPREDRQARRALRLERRGARADAGDADAVL
jgi:acyl-CoA synthetase (AMP-forming)/AMP-acid ligase II